MLSGGLFNRSIYCLLKAYTQTMEPKSGKEICYPQSFPIEG